MNDVWLQTIPLDLRGKLESVTGYRSFGPKDLWGEIREWLELHGVEVPQACRSISRSRAGGRGQAPTKACLAAAARNEDLFIPRDLAV